MVTTNIKATKAAGGGDYTTLVAWEVGRRGDLVAGDRAEIAEVYGGGGVGGVTLQAADWTTDATRKVIIRAAAGEECNGVYNASKAFVNGAMLYYVGFVDIGPGLTIDWAGDAVRPDSITATSTSLVERNVIVSQYEGVVASNCSGLTLTVKNCIIYRKGTGGFYAIWLSYSKRIEIYNCTIYIPAAGSCIGTYGPANYAMISQNNYLACEGGAGHCYEVNGTPITKGANDATSTTEAITPSLRSIAHTNANFINTTPTLEDMHLTNTSALRMVGATLSSVTNDIDGDSRLGLLYDIGADQQSDVPVCWNYTAKYRNSNKLFKASGCGCFPRNLRVPGNIDTSTGRMVDDGVLIDPSEYRIL